MGYAIAESLADNGAMVTLVSGKTSLSMHHANVQVVAVETAEQMYRATVASAPENDIIIHCAAVADYTPRETATQKIKKKDNELLIELVKTKDIAKEVGDMLMPHQFHVGFALETNDEVKNASEKLLRKKFDMIILNSLQDKGAGFEHDTNKITIIDKENKVTHFPLKSKTDLAQDIVNMIISKIK